MSKLKSIFNYVVPLLGLSLSGFILFMSMLYDDVYLFIGYVVIYLYSIHYLDVYYKDKYGVDRDV